MKILLINNQHYHKGGAHTVYFNTGELLQKYGHEVFYFAMKDEHTLPYEYDEYFPKAIDYRELFFTSKIKAAKSFIYNREAYKKLTEYIKLIKPDVAHVHLFMGGLTVSILEALKDNNIPVVHTVHDYRLICPAYTFLDKDNNVCEKCKDGVYIRCALKRCSLESNFSNSFVLSMDAYYRKYFKNPIDLIDKFIFVSDFSRKIHCKFNTKFNDKAIRIYNFSSCIPANNYHKKGNYFFYFGRLSREKGIDKLIEAASELNINLKIAGNGPLLSELVTKANESIEFLGYKSGNELYDLILNSSFIVLPSQWYENNPLSIIESFSFGKPVIGSNIGGIPELINNNRGILFESTDTVSLKKALFKAINLPQNEYNYYSQNAYNFAKNELSEKKYYQLLLETYKSLIYAK